MLNQNTSGGPAVGAYALPRSPSRNEGVTSKGRKPTSEGEGGEGNPPKVQVIEVNRKTLLEYGIRFYTGNTLCYAGGACTPLPQIP